MFCSTVRKHDISHDVLGRVLENTSKTCTLHKAYTRL